MAHVQKINRNGVANMLAHDDRSQKNIGNVDVDSSLSYLNYSFTDNSKSAFEKYKEIMDRPDVHCLKRKDVNTLVSWVITSPKNMTREREREFFENCDFFLRQRYGKNCNYDNDLCPSIDNIVSSVVHMDETTPHLHFKFIPLVEDDKNIGEYKVSAKEVIKKADLLTFHRDLDIFLETLYGRGYFPSVRNGITKEQGNQSIKKLKSNTLKKLECRADDLNAQIRSQKADLDVLRLEKVKILEDIEKAENKASALESRIDILESGLKASCELTDLLESVIPLAEILKDEYARTTLQKVKEKKDVCHRKIEKAYNKPNPDKKIKKPGIDR